MTDGRECGKRDGHDGWHRSVESVAQCRAFTLAWAATHREQRRTWQAEYYIRNREKVRNKVAKYQATTIMGATRHDREKMTPEEGRAYVAEIEKEIANLAQAN